MILMRWILGRHLRKVFILEWLTKCPLTLDLLQTTHTFAIFLTSRYLCCHAEYCSTYYQYRQVFLDSILEKQDFIEIGQAGLMRWIANLK